MGYFDWDPGKMAPYFTLYVNGVELSTDLRRRVKSIRVSHAYQEAMMANVVIVDEDMRWVDLDIFAKGVEWAVVLGSNVDFRVFGPFEVSAYQMTFGEDNICAISLDLQDKSRVLMRTAKNRSFSGMTIGDVVEKIALENGLGYKISSAEKVIFNEEAPAMQPGWTDAQFLKKIANRYGYYFAIQDGNLIFRQEQENKDTQTRVFTWRVGDRSLMSFQPAQTTYGGKGTGAGDQAGGSVEASGVDVPSGTEFQEKMSKEDMAKAAGTEGEFGSGEVDSETDAIMGQTGIWHGARVNACVDPSVNAGAYADDSAARTIVEKFATVGDLLGNPDKKAVVFETIIKMARDVTDTPKDQKDAKAVLPPAGAGTKSDLALATAKLTTYDVLVRQGDPCEVVGVSRRFSGRWWIYEFEHDLDDRGLFTTLKMGKKALGASKETKKAEDEAAGQGKGSSRVAPGQETMGAVLGDMTQTYTVSKWGLLSFQVAKEKTK